LFFDLVLEVWLDMLSSHRKRSVFPVIAAKSRLLVSKRKFFNYNACVKRCHISVGGEPADYGCVGGALLALWRFEFGD